MPGFLLGTAYVNLLAKKYVAEPGIFSDYFLSQFQTIEINVGEYIWYLLRLRLLPLAMLAFFSFTRLRKAAAVLFLIWAGISGGILISLAVLSLGIKGSFLCLAGIFPQFLCYVPAYLILIWHCCSYPQNRWNRQKTAFVSAAMLIGLILEIYVNPSVVRAFLSTM